MKLEYSKQKPVTLLEAKQRALAVLPRGKGCRPIPAAWVAQAIWPQHAMQPQGAGAAATRILKRLEEEGKARWDSNRHGWGWIASSK